MIRLPKPIRFEWDDGNKEKNWVKHHVSMVESEEAFMDSDKKIAHVMLRSTEGEQRFILLGKTRLERLLFIVFTLRERHVRVISARDINSKERPLYEERN